MLINAQNRKYNCSYMITNEPSDRHILGHERRAILLSELNENGYILATEMAEKLNITAITVRRDLAQLEKEGLCIRKRGGAARSTQGVSLELPYQIKQNSNIDEKKRIAEAAVRFVNHGSTIILDAGSTTYALALLLSQKRITVVTNDLQIAVKLAASPNINLICTGGFAQTNVFSLHGSQVETFIRSLRVDMTFLGADAIHRDGIVSNVNLEEAMIKQAMIAAAEKVILLADSSKFEKAGFAKVCHLSDLNTIITDSGISEDKLGWLKSINIETVII
jgi:DeoR/GlpR family transcriptional regulator of sugar metabolism